MSNIKKYIKKFGLFIYFNSIFFLHTLCNAQSIGPTLKGSVNLSIKTGSMICDLKLVDIPPLSDYLILINSGMNIRFIKSCNSNIFFDFGKTYVDSISYEAFGYYLTHLNQSKVDLPKELHFNYCGQFPVMDSNNYPNTGDWKGNIAFNGTSIRADGNQSSWYPVIYDVKQKKAYTEIKCDIEFTCFDCNSIFLNGNDVQNAFGNSIFKFKSDKNVELLLFAGNFSTNEHRNTVFINPSIDKREMDSISRLIGDIKNFLEEVIRIKYEYKINFLQTSPTSKDNSWMFMSYPTIVDVSPINLANNGVFQYWDNQYKKFLAHELAHYYFGFHKTFNTKLGDIMMEGFPEYLSFRFIRQSYSDSLYSIYLDRKIKTLQFSSLTPISTLHTFLGSYNREIYAYHYFPIILLAIEKEIGEKKMDKWMTKILSSKSHITDFNFLAETLSMALFIEKLYNRMSEKYFFSKNAAQNAIEKLKQKQPY